jgi:flagellar motor switch protein FliM
VSAALDPEEVQALLDPAGQPRRREVVERDFRRPRRLSADGLERLRAAMRAAASGLSELLSDALGDDVEVELADASESSLEDALAALEDAPLLLAFELEGRPAWLAWQSGAAVAAVERVLGSPAPARSARRLSRFEVRVASRLFGELARRVATALGREADGFRLVQERDEAASLRDADPHRVRFTLAVRDARGESLIEALLPGLEQGAEASPTAAGASIPLPAHLRPVEVDLAVRLPGCELPLAELLALEEGDVIPLDTRVGDSFALTVEGEPFARVVLGRVRGRLAVRIERTDPRSIET